MSGRRLDIGQILGHAARTSECIVGDTYKACGEEFGGDFPTSGASLARNCAEVFPSQPFRGGASSSPLPRGNQHFGRVRPTAALHAGR